MKKYILAAILVLAANIVSAADIDNGQTIKIKTSGNDVSISNPFPVSSLPYPECNYVYHESTGTLTDHAIIAVAAGHTIQVYGIDIHSLDTINKGIVYFEDSDNSHFYAGYLSTAPSAFGTQLNFTTIGTTLRVTTSGATAIVVHYRDISGGI